MASIWTGITIPPAEVLNSVSANDRTIAVTASRSTVRLTYGTDRLAAQLLNILPTADGKKLVVQCLWGFAVDGISELKLNDQELPAKATVTHYLGTQTVPDPTLVAAMAAQVPSIPYTSSLVGYAYSVLVMPISSFDGQLNVSALIRGRRVYDPRQDSTNGGSGPQRLNDSTTWTYSDNPALVFADWTRNSVYGAGCPVVWSSVMATAAANDALVGNERRRTIAVTTSGATECRVIAETLRAYAGCWCIPTAAGIRFVPDQDAAPVDNLAHGDGRLMRLDPLVMADNLSTPTAVEVIYTDTTQKPWAEASAIAQLQGAGSTRPWRLSQVRLPGIQRYSQAMREATERLNKLTLCPVATTIEVADEGLKYEHADIITLSHPAGLALQPMRVLNVAMLGPGSWQLELQQHDPSVYGSSVQTKPVVPGTALDSPTGPPENVDFFDVQISAGNLRRFNFGYTGERPPLLAGVQIRYRSGVGAISLADWDDLTPLGSADDVYPASFETSRPPAGTWTFAARAIRMSGQRADSLATETITLPAPFPENDAPDPTPPPTPTNMTVMPGVGLLVIKHDTPTYTQGHGHGKTRIYGEQWTAGALPVFADAALVGEFTGPIGTFATGLGTTWRLWTTWVTMDDYESVAPAGGANGIEGTTGKIGSADLAPLAVTAAALADEAVNLGSTKVTGTITDPARFGALAVGYTVTQYLLVTEGYMAGLYVDNAQIGSLNVSKLLGGSMSVGSYIQSSNYAQNAMGWRINANGTAEFRGVTIAGPSTFDGQVTIRAPDGSITFQSGGVWSSSAGAAAWQNSNLLPAISEGAVGNIVTNPSGAANADGWTGATAVAFAWRGVGLARALRMDGRDSEFGQMVRVNPGDAFVVSYESTPDVTDDVAVYGSGAGLRLFNSAGQFLGTLLVNRARESRGPVSFSGVLTIPAGVAFMRPAFYIDGFDFSAAGSKMLVRNFTVLGQITGSNVTTYIADAAIPSAKIGSLSAQLISTGINGGTSSGVQIVQNVISVFNDAGAEVCTLGRLS